ncbi:serine/threonine protein kinase [Stanieria sp. NIES-3757]|nr:serine/threonine protein kinase [Stanieria sp. NIES-3757]
MTSTPLNCSNHHNKETTSQPLVELNLSGVFSSLKVSQCLNPQCLKLNQEKSEFCQVCGHKLFLQERYRAIKYLSQGGFSHTFIGVDKLNCNRVCLIKQFDRQVVIKAEILGEREAEILKYLGDHPKIPNLLAFFVHENQVYLIAELITGQNLLQVQQQAGYFSQSQVINILNKLLPVLEFIHQRQVIHRDIKPSNIIYREDQSVALIDFGSSIFLKSKFQHFTPIAGTPGYAAPEQLQGQVYPASDLYSLGVTTWQLLTGIMPPETGITDKWIWQSNDLALDRNFTQIITKLLQPNWRDRYQSATEVLDALSTLMPQSNQIEILNHNFSETNYQQLKDLLAQQNYQEAEQVTWQLILKLAQREVQGCLNLTAINNLPIAQLKIIDLLWRNYSRDRFGFSVQKRIYQNLLAATQLDYLGWQKFAQQVGWYQQEQWLNYAQLNFTNQAPIGHLPVCLIDVFNRGGINRHVCGWWRTGFLTFMEKIIF